MPSSIPYDPSLVLGQIIHQDVIKNVINIAKAQAPVDAAQDEVNTLIASRRSFGMLKTELLNMDVTDTQEVDEAIKSIGDALVAALKDYATKTIKANTDIKGYRANIIGVHSDVESPIDYVKSVLKPMALAADSMSMDVQYFSNDTNDQKSDSQANSIASFVSATTAHLGTKVSAEVSAAAKKQASNQTTNHSIEGTLVLSVTCTHKNATVLSPMVINVDKGIRAWNAIFPEKEDRLEPTDPDQMTKLAESAGKEENPKKYSIISGMTFGSSFVGMVHILNASNTSASESLVSMVGSLQAQMDTGAWLEKASGGIGVNTSMSRDVKNLLSTQNINAHVTLISMGLIPSVVANDVAIGVQGFAKFDPAASMEQIATLQNATAATQTSIQASATAARTGQAMVALKTGDMKAALSALAEISDGKNKVIDINSMMTALDDYLKKAADGKAGIPINYYTSDITKLQLAELWVDKYMPGKYMKVTSVDGQEVKNVDANPDKPGTTG